MTTFNSGKRAELGLPLANHDTLPWRHPFGPRFDVRPLIGGGSVELDPRPEFDLPDNSILVEYRKWRRDLGPTDEWLLDRFLDALGDDVRAPEAIREPIRGATEAERVQARRVLAKVAAHAGRTGASAPESEIQ